MAKILKFQYRFKIHNTELNLTEDYSLKTILISKSAKVCE